MSDSVQGVIIKQKSMIKVKSSTALQVVIWMSENIGVKI